MRGKNLVSLLATMLFCVAPAVFTATAAHAVTLKFSVDSVDFEPGGHIRTEITTQGFTSLLATYPKDMKLEPISSPGVTASMAEGVARWDIDRPGAEVSIPFTAALPNTPNKKLTFTVKGFTAEGGTLSRNYVIWTKQERLAAPAAVTPTAPPAAAPPGFSLPEYREEGGQDQDQGSKKEEVVLNTEDDEDDSPYDENDNPLTRGGLSLSLTYNKDLDSFKDKGVDLGALRTFTNMEVSAVTRITPVVASKKGNLDLKPIFGYYSTDGVNSHSSEPLADGGGSFMRGGLLARLYTDSSVLELGPAINWGDTIKESKDRISGIATWKQKISLNWLGLKGRTAENTLRGVLNGPFLSWNIRDQIDFPIDNPSRGKPLYYFSLGTTHSANWDKNDRKNNWYDWQTWGGLTIKIKPWSGTGGVVVAENGMSAYTEQSIALEGANRKLR